MTPPSPDRSLSDVLTRLWDGICGFHPTLPPVTIAITTQHPSSDHGPERWGDGSAVQIAVSRDTLEEGAEATLTAVLHDAAHLLNWGKGISDTTRRGSYHNRRFAEAADVVGLSWPTGQPAPASSGFRDVVLSDRAKAYPGTAPLLAELEQAIAAALPVLAPRRETARSRTRVTAHCACTPPRRIELPASTLNAGPIRCEICGALFAATTPA